MFTSPPMLSLLCHSKAYLRKVAKNITIFDAQTANGNHWLFMNYDILLWLV